MVTLLFPVCSLFKEFHVHCSVCFLIHKSIYSRAAGSTSTSIFLLRFSLSSDVQKTVEDGER